MSKHLPERQPQQRDEPQQPGSCREQRQPERAAQSAAPFPIVDEATAQLPFLRMVVLDASLRWAAYQALRISRGHKPVPVAPWLTDELPPPKLTLAELRKRVRASRNTVNAWRAGTSLPSDSNLVERCHLS